MSYVKTNWVNGTTPVNADNMNKIENELETLDTGKLDASKSAVAGVGGLTTGENYITENLTITGQASTIAFASGNSGITITSSDVQLEAMGTSNNSIATKKYVDDAIGTAIGGTY